MKISYDRLWKLLIDKKINKTQLKELAGINSNCIAKMGKDEPVHMEVLMKICNALECSLEDIVEYPSKKEEGGTILKTDKIHSDVLNKEMNIAIYAPEEYKDVNLPVLYFLHGRTGNENILQQLKINDVASKLIKEKTIKPMIIVCPNLDNSRGINSSNNYKEVQGKYGIVHLGLYEDYLIKEVIPYIDKNYKTICNRESRYIGGISSGGYVALHNGLRHQDLFSKIGGHMPAIDLSYADEDECYFKSEEIWNKYNPITIVKNNDVNSVKIYLDDGNEDEGKFYISCEKLYNSLKEKNVDVEYNLFAGHHNAEYILSNLERYLKFYNS